VADKHLVPARDLPPLEARRFKPDRDLVHARARLAAVEFIDCTLAGADFRGAKVTACAIRGSSLDDVLGVDGEGS
jgi:uncharacterized protein YjbI with pentapeptide repeats